MTRTLIARLGWLLLLGASVAAHAAAPVIERIEPGNWWVGMHSDRLQLMVHGKDIADATPQLDYPGVRIDAVTRVANRNYVFVDLRIGADARPGTLPLQFRAGDKVLRYAYPLLQREPGSAERIGFSSADAILNLVPDRFANGDPSNDNVPGYADRANRASNGAGRHGGDIQGIVDHLDYIAGMGYTMIWPTPLVENNMPAYSYHGYAATDLYKIDPRFGSNESYRQMVQAARQHGLGVIQDIVLNHIGSGHWWMKDLPTPDWINYDGKFVPTRHARTAISDAYAAQEDRDNFTKGWFTKDMPDINQSNPLVATYQIQNAIWWVEYAGLSGIRIDTYGYSDTAFLSQWSQRLMQEYPHLGMVGEEWSINPLVVSYWQRGKVHANGYVSGLPSLFDFPMNATLRSALTEQDNTENGLMKLYMGLANDVVYPDPQSIVMFEGNHDMVRLYTALHDDAALVRIALAYTATAPRIAQFYYGTEVLMGSLPTKDDGEIRRDFPGGWAGDKVNAFTGAGLSAEQLATQKYMKQLLNWRKTQPVIHHGKMLHYAPIDGTYVYFRYDATHIVMVVLNKNDKDTSVDTARFHEILTGHTHAVDALSRQPVELGTSVTVPARSALLLEVQ